jgi:hypothetical protein
MIPAGCRNLSGQAFRFQDSGAKRTGMPLKPLWRRGGLYPDIFKITFPQNTAVCHAVYCYAARKAEPLQSCFFVKVGYHLRMISSVTDWILAAMSISLCVISVSGFLGDPPKSLEKCLLVIRRPPRKSK